jgi:hypothetical protein
MDQNDRSVNRPTQTIDATTVPHPTINRGLILGWIVIGIVAGWLTGKIMKGLDFGWLMDMVIGLIGAPTL